MKLPFLLSVPHAGLSIPEEVEEMYQAMKLEVAKCARESDTTF